VSGNSSEVRCEVCWFDDFDRRLKNVPRRDEVTLCRRCADTNTAEPLAAGNHSVTFSPAGEGWACSCGQGYQPPVFLAPRVVAAIPNPVAATARLHVQAHTGLTMSGGR
jgi:hypothetical protein